MPRAIGRDGDPAISVVRYPPHDQPSRNSAPGSAMPASHDVVDPGDDVLGLRETDVPLQFLAERLAPAGGTSVVDLEDPEPLVDECLERGIPQVGVAPLGPPWIETIVG